MGKFEIHETASGAFRFNLKAGNGQIIAVSESYSALDGCKNVPAGIYTSRSAISK